MINGTTPRTIPRWTKANLSTGKTITIWTHWRIGSTTKPDTPSPALMEAHLPRASANETPMTRDTDLDTYSPSQALDGISWL